MVYCDTNEKILEWASEEKCVAYRSPIDGKVHRYFPDFIIKVKEENGSIKKYVIEIKPKRQTKGYIYEAYEYAKNQAKWAAAREWCADRGYEFKVITEDELGIK